MMRPSLQSFRRGAPFVFILLSLAASIPLARPTASAAPVGTASVRVSVFGDSVLLGAKEQLISQLAPWPVAVDAEENRSLLGAISILQRAQHTLGNVVVLDLGYNDGTDHIAFRQRIDGAMAALSGVPRVVWLNQSEFAVGRSGMNTELSAAAARYPNLDVVDWNAAVVSHPEFVYADHIHLTPAGQAAVASIVRERIEAFLTPQQIPTTTTTTPVTAPTKSRPSPSSVRHQPTARGGSQSTALIGGLLASIVVMLVALAALRRRASRPRATKLNPESVSSARRSPAASGPRQRGSRSG
jgi:lysophospholipase L1-like esterase